MTKYTDVIDEMVDVTWEDHSREEAYLIVNPPKWLNELVNFAYLAGQWSAEEERA